MKNLYCYDNEIIKWIYGDNLYCLHIQHDDEEDNNPRWWDDHDSTMACFHSRYNLGDKVDAKTPEEFWNDMVYKYCSNEEIYNALVSCSLNDLAAIRDEIDEGRYNVWAIHKENGEVVRDEVIYDNDFYVDSTMEEIVTAVNGELSIRDCQILLDKHIAWLPLWLHDHSGLSMDCDTRFRGSWDDSNVGWIVIAITDGSDETKNEAERIMRNEVEIYSDYLSGENYGYTLYREEHGEWKEIDRAFGFIGTDVFENGIAYSAGCGLETALKEDRCNIGEAEKVVTVTYNFDNI